MIWKGFMPISGLSCVRTDGGTEVLHEALADLKRMLFALIDDQGISIVLFSVRSVLLYTIRHILHLSSRISWTVIAAWEFWHYCKLLSTRAPADSSYCTSLTPHNFHFPQITQNEFVIKEGLLFPASHGRSTTHQMCGDWAKQEWEDEHVARAHNQGDCGRWQEVYSHHLW